VDSFSRFPFCVPLRSLTARAICDALLEVWQFTGCSSYLSSDLGSNLTAQLTKEFEKRMGCSPRFNSPYHSQSTGLVERYVTMLAVWNVLSLSWRWIIRNCGIRMCPWRFGACLRESVNQTTGVAPWTLVMGYVPRGPLAILRDSWRGHEIKCR